MTHTHDANCDRIVDLLLYDDTARELLASALRDFERREMRRLKQNREAKARYKARKSA